MGIAAQNWYEGRDAGSAFASYKVVQKKTLNFFEIEVNSNKFYTIEIHEGNGEYRIFSEYGRLGVTSTKQVREYSGMTLSTAQREFESIIREKTRKGYAEVDLAQSSTGSSEAKRLIDANEIKSVAPIKAENQSNLEPQVRKFVQHIFEESGAALSSFISGQETLDKKAPLGKLSTKQINIGRDILQEIANALVKQDLDSKEITKLSSDYRRTIPRSFGLRRISLSEALVDTNDKISTELDLLKFYEDSLRMEDVIVSDDIDKRYESLNSDIWPILPGSDLWNHLEQYMIKSQSDHHYVQLSAVSMYGVKQKMAPEFKKEIGNVKELFHGSRTANLPGILSSYLKLPTQLSGVYITGAMFGPGIYFADQSTKSTQYATSRFGGRQNQHNTAFLFVADVACGKIKEEQSSYYHLKAPAGYDSVKGVAGRSLLHNEYIVYDSGQQAIRYIIEFASHSR